MSERNDLFNISMVGKTGLTTVTKGQCVALHTTENQFTNCAANEDNVCGVMRDSSVSAGETANIQVAGIAKILVASAVSIGDLVYVADTSGRIAKFTPGVTPSGVSIVGKVLKAADTANDLAKVLLTIPTMYHT